MSPLAITGIADRRLHRADRRVLDRPRERARARPAVHGERCHPRRLGDARDRHRVAMSGIAAGADLERHRHVDRPDDRREDRPDERLVREQRGARGDVADLLRGAAHVDVDDLRAACDVVARRVRHEGGIRAGDLHRDRRRLALVVSATPRFLRAAKLRIRGDHLGDGVPRAEALAQETKRPIGDARHRRDGEIVRKVVRSDAHGRRKIVIERNACRGGKRIITAFPRAHAKHSRRIET